MKLIIFVVLVLQAPLLFAQQEVAERKPVLIYTCGETPFAPDSCYLKCAAKYSLAVKDMGCILNKKIERRFNTNNRRANRKLSKLYGKNWQKNFKEEIETCRKNL